MHARAISGERVRLACGRRRPPPSRAFFKECFGEAPKPAREARALPRMLRFNMLANLAVGDAGSGPSF